MTPRTTDTRAIERSLTSVVDWVQRHRYRAYEPADGNSSILFRLTGKRVLPMRVLQQVVLRSPFNIRPLLGIMPHESAIGRGYMAWGYTLMCRGGAPASIRAEADACFEWLIANRAAGYEDFCWGDPYEYATRSGRRPEGEPLLIWSALIGQAFLDAFETFGNPRHLRVAESIGAWIRKLPFEQTDTGICLSYVAYRQSSIHNSNAMGAAFLARLGAIVGDDTLLALARSVMAYTCTRQRADGAWLYAEDARYHWVDSFHTGYNLSALKTYRAASGDRTFDLQLSRGAAYFRTHFFGPEGQPSYFDNGAGPIDIQCAAQAVETLVALSADDPACLAEAVKVATWTVSHMQAPDGHFYYRDIGWTTVRTPMLHWGQGTMVKALAMLLNRLAETHAKSHDDADIRADYARA